VKATTAPPTFKRRVGYDIEDEEIETTRKKLRDMMVMDDKADGHTAAQ
jgi:hypothetical protein